MITKQKKLGQFFTPVWAAELLFNETFTDLTANDIVWEPSCGTGNFLSAVPRHVSAVGTDIDADLAQAAAKNTNRPVYCGDFRYVQFTELSQITAIVGNPPFQLHIFEEFMRRCENILPLGKKAAFILPAYFFQTSKTFNRLARKWDIAQQFLPRDIFNDGGLLSKPIAWASFVRDNFPKLVGFRLYNELGDVNILTDEVKDIVTNQINNGGSVWRQALIKVVADHGGTVTLNQVYENMQRKRPTQNPFWKQQVRKLIQQAPFERVGHATYKLN